MFEKCNILKCLKIHHKQNFNCLVSVKSDRPVCNRLNVNFYKTTLKPFFSVRVCLYVLCGHLLGKGWPLGSRLWCLLWVCHFPIGILGQVWYLIVSIPDLCTITYILLNENTKFLMRQIRILIFRLFYLPISPTFCGQYISVKYT